MGVGLFLDKCPVCDRKYSYESEVLNHLERHHDPHELAYGIVEIKKQVLIMNEQARLEKELWSDK
jgi:hypothetical protein